MDKKQKQSNDTRADRTSRTTYDSNNYGNPKPNLETCGFCSTPCGNAWCVTKQPGWKERKKREAK